LVPGSGFGQVEGSYHFRTTILILPEEKLMAKFEDLNKFTSKFNKNYF